MAIHGHEVLGTKVDGWPPKGRDTMHPVSGHRIHFAALPSVCVAAALFCQRATILSQDC